MEAYRSLVIGMATVQEYIALSLGHHIILLLQRLADGDDWRGSDPVGAGCGRIRSDKRDIWPSQKAGMRMRQNILWILGLGVAIGFGPALNQPSVTLAAEIIGQPTIARGVSRAPHPDTMAAAAAQEPPVVTYHNGRLSVYAERVPLVRILQEISRQTGLEVQGLSSLQRDVAVQFTDLPLLDGLRRLLAPVNYLLLIERSPQGGIQRLQAVVFGRETTPSFGRLPGEGSPPGRQRLPAEALRQAMADADPSMRRWAVERLGEQGAEQAFTHLLTALDDADLEVRQGALVSLSQYGERALQPLQTLLQREQDHTLRIVALQVLGQVGREDGETMPLLHEMLTDHDSRIRAAVVEALGHVGGPRATDALHTAAHDGNSAVRLAALRALALYVRDSSAQAAVEEHLDDTDEVVRDSAAALLEMFTQ